MKALFGQRMGKDIKLNREIKTGKKMRTEIDGSVEDYHIIWKSDIFVKLEKIKKTVADDILITLYSATATRNLHSKKQQKNIERIYNVKRSIQI